MEKQAPTFSSFEDFWPFYVRQHSKSGTRTLHFAGTTAGLFFLAGAMASRRPVLLLWGLVLSYGLAWVGHFFIEKNRPATFQHPAWSLRGDFRMYGLMWRGRMVEEMASIVAAEISLAGTQPAPPTAGLR